MAGLGRWFTIVGLVGLARLSFAQPAPGEEAPPPEPAPPAEQAPTLEQSPPPQPEPAPSPPIQLPQPQPIVAAVETGYPLSLAARPLVLPESAVEGAGELVYQTIGFGGSGGSSDSIDSLIGRAHARYGLPSAEVEAGVDLSLYFGAPDTLMLADPPPLARVYAAGRFASTRDFTLGGQLAISRPTDQPTYSPRVVIANKQHFAAAAIQLELSGGVDHSQPDMGEALNLLQLGGVLRAQAQVSKPLTIEGYASLDYTNLIGTSPFMGYPDDYLSQTFGFRAYAAVTDSLDLFADMVLLRSGGNPGDGAAAYTLGLLVRRVP